MKKLLCLFAVIALAAPIYAADPNVVITCAETAPGSHICRVSWEVLVEDGVDPGLVRGFAMDITVSGNATIDEITNYAAEGQAGGDETAIPDNYSIYISSLVFESDPNFVNAWGDPVATGTGALGGLTTNGITVELASLYPEGGTAPPTSGVLFDLKIEGNGDDTADVTIIAETLRGGIVMENVASASLISTGCTMTGLADCFGVIGAEVTQAEYDAWEAFGKPDCWCYARQCYGDVNGTPSGGAALGWWYVGAPDVSILAAAWKVKEPPKGSGILSIPNGICADINHAASGGAALGWWRVGAPDISLLTVSWKVKEPPKGSGVPTDCVANPITP